MGFWSMQNFNNNAFISSFPKLLKKGEDKRKKKVIKLLILVSPADVYANKKMT